MSETTTAAAPAYKGTPAGFARIPSRRHLSTEQTMQSSTIPNTWRNDTPLAARSYSTGQAAQILLLSPQTLRNAMCRSGEYAGIRPMKLPNRFLAWPADQVDALARGEA